MTETLLSAGLIAAALTYAGVPFITRRTRNWGVVDVPNARSSHAVPTPRGGGLLIAGIVLIAFPVLAAINGSLSWRAILTWELAAGGLAILGWLDDRKSLTALLRLSVHTGIALLIVIGLGYFRHLSMPFLGTVDLGWLGVPLTVVWVVGLCNAYNFMDGIDGLAGGQACITGLLWTALGLYQGSSMVALLGLMIAACSFGFLIHNWSPARLFMGDVGSGFLGVSFAMLPLIAGHYRSDARYPIAAALFVGLFVFDTSLTFMRRLVRRENVLHAHRSHLYQRMVAAGYSHSAVTVLYMLLGCAIGSAGLFYIIAPEPVSSLAAAAALLLMGALAFAVHSIERRRLLPRQSALRNTHRAL